MKINIIVPDNLLKKIDRIVKTSEEYNHRTDFILTAIREAMRK